MHSSTARSFLVALCAGACAIQVVAAAQGAPDKITFGALPFALRDVRLLPGPCKHAQELDRKYLLSLDVDRLLHTFRLNAGLPSDAQPLGGWEEPKCELRGHFIGHYLTACALMHAATGDADVKAKGDAVVSGLAECQAKLGSGYLSAYPEEFFDRVERQQQVWAPYYTLHKIYAGLLDMYAHCGNAKALEVCRKFADWAIARNGRLTDEQMQAMLGAEHGGMNEALAELYAVTGEKKYLDISLRFNHKAVIDPAAAGQDRLTGLHANTQIPKFVGTARQYELTGEQALRTASLAFWKSVAGERSYVIGGNSDGEHFSPKETLSRALGPATTETCNTYNMLKLTRHLFAWEPRAEYADFYERGLYNHILASQNPEDGMTCYYVPLRSGSAKGGRGYGYSTPLNAFWCCTGTGVENHAKYGDSIYFHGPDATLFVNLFIASELTWKERGLTLRQETSYPESQGTRLVFTCRELLELAVHVRHPSWATSGLVLSVNGQEQKAASTPGSYAVVKRVWKSGDTLEVSLPFTLRTEGFRDNPDRFAFLYGPLVLCAEVDPGKPFPAVVGSPEETLGAVSPIAGRTNKFTCREHVLRIAGGGASSAVTLEPFYQMHGTRHYVVYWDRFSPEAWKEKEEAYRAEAAKQKELDERTVDVVNPGEQQSETDHRLRGERTSSGEFANKKYRHAEGWFSYEVKVLPEGAQELCVTYWGSDGGRVFDVLVDDVKLVTQRLERKHPDRFYEEVTALPEAMTKGKTSVTVKFQAQAGSMAGGVFGVRILKARARATASISIDAGKAGARIDPRLYGIFLEEINHGVDGGLYAELIANRSFEDSRAPEGFTLKDGRWKDAKGYDCGYEVREGQVPHWSLVADGDAKGAIRVELASGLNVTTPCCLRVDVESLGTGRIAVANDGFWGIGVKEGAAYDLTLYARSADGLAGPLNVGLQDASGKPCSTTAALEGVGAEWKQFKAALTGSRTEAKARLVIGIGAKGTLWLDFVSLFPRETWKGRGLRADIAQMIADLKPGFVRFPGGCVVEGGSVETAYNWKLTIGALEERAERWGAWNYRRTHGMGFHEYLQFCEDLGAEPLHVGFAGQTCLFRELENVPLEEMGWVTQDFLDAIEYANGPAESTWGALRVKAGHPAPFGLKLIEIGNENGTDAFPPRYNLVHKALKARHPQIKYIADLSWIGRDLMRACAFDIEDNHFYNTPRWFLSNFDLYAKRDRALPPVYVGEVAVTSEEGGDLKGNLIAALAEAVFLMGCEHNGDVVKMVSYAPLLAHVDGRSGWHGMIYHDSLRVFGTASYYAWKLLGTNRPDYMVPSEVRYAPVKAPAIAGGIGVGTWDTSAEFKDIRVEKGGAMLLSTDFTQEPKGWKIDGGAWSARDGAYRQSANAVGFSFTGDPTWTDYTVALKARKLGGTEGFLVCFGRAGGEQYWWNLGGWGNREHGLEHNRNPVGRRVRGKIETDRWYDVKVELSGRRIRCYLDGTLIHDETAPTTDRFVAVAGFDEAAGEIVVKAVNTSDDAVQASVELRGAKPATNEARLTVITSGRMDDNNSFREPTKVAPTTATVPLAGAAFTHAFPARSLTILRLKTVRT